MSERDHEFKEFKVCIKGIDYEGRATWNEYSWLADLGSGVYAKVILAQKNVDFSRYAIKQLKKTKLSKNARSEFDLDREIDVQKGFWHDNMVRLYEVIDDEEDEKLHMVMEYCPGGEIMRFDEANVNFSPPKALLM
mmetsp:Transcript_7392/g.12478  ORF Transcript_7392/g.12478 Transcript_7392/m.12478 type:complete len:136 (+) Transcript_7392:3-410(+)